MNTTKNHTNLNYNSNSYARQLVLPLDYEHRIDLDDPVRTLDAVLEELNYGKLLSRFSTKGRKNSVPPHILFKLVIWGLMEGYTSIRQLYRASRTNLQALWLLNGYEMNSHMVLGRFFAKLTPHILEDLFVQFVKVLQNIDKLPFSEIYIDGTKMEANANRYTFKWKKTIQRYLDRNNEKRSIFNEELAENFNIPAPEMTDEEILMALNERIDSENISLVHGRCTRKHPLQRQLETHMLLNERQTRYETDLAIMGKRNSYSKTDHDATFMRMKDDHMRNGQLKPGYNLQLAVASEYIVHVGIFQNPNDTKTLIPFLEKFKDLYGCLPNNIVADAGYYSEENLYWLDQMMTNSVIKPSNYEIAKKRSYKNDIGRAENMEYCPERDMYFCKAGQALTYQFDSIKRMDRYTTNYKVYRAENCEGCIYRPQCQKPIRGEMAKKPKSVRIASNKTKQLQEKNLARLCSEEGILLRQNRSIQVEGVFAQMKQNAKKRRLSRRGHISVYMEMLLFALSFNVLKLHNRIQKGRLQQQYFCQKETA